MGECMGECMGSRRSMLVITGTPSSNSYLLPELQQYNVSDHIASTLRAQYAPRYTHHRGGAGCKAVLRSRIRTLFMAMARIWGSSTVSTGIKCLAVSTMIPLHAWRGASWHEMREERRREEENRGTREEGRGTRDDGRKMRAL